MTRRRASILGASVLFGALCVTTACGSDRLDTQTATEVLKKNSLLADLTPIEVQAVSQGESEAEAIARVAIDGHVLNLKFRRYDDGWRWEFAETKAGGWIAPDVVAQQLTEERRAKKAAAWASKYRDEYEKTIQAMQGYSQNLPRRPQMTVDVESWLKGRSLWADIPARGRTPQELEAVRMKLLGSDHDAWGNEILLSFDDSKRSAVFVSIGPDKTKGTPDDVICIVKGLREWDSTYDEALYNYYKSWQVPEGLEDLAKPFAGELGKGAVSPSKVVQ